VNDGVRKPGDRESGPVGAEVLAPGRSAFADGQMSWGGEGPTALGFGVGASIGTLSVPQRWVARTTPAPDAVELQSDWVREPIRLVHAAATQQVRHDDCSEGPRATA
jgi:hypothetical protein